MAELMKANDKIIEIHDHYGDECLVDSISHMKKGARQPRGMVEIYEVGLDGIKKLSRKSNLVIYLGRELICERMFKTQNTNITPDIEEFICWAGLGCGGVNPADPFDPYSPCNQDIELEEDVPIHATNANYADYHHGFYHKVPITTTYIQDTDNDSAWLINRVGLTFGVEDAVSKQISEAGLFTAGDNSGGFWGPFHLFARVTFPTIIKSSTIQLVFVWYLYF